ncbi:aurora kinase A and ninein-interacting protein [Polypterus senegalus]|uniref:aurora kinase A and ninein-interacting protein n=1 Tax=Polypterus senegalus TaxID=55291 RepID=UPI00196314C7|nr:aurora kinase A and ninein-interacting protein [Polypterus senegalus]
MKKSKVAVTETEECGIWLDTSQLKEKRKRVPVFRPISKLLNPLSKSGYNINVAINFTQTRAPMPNTKQTTISSYLIAESSGKKNEVYLNSEIDITKCSESEHNDTKSKSCIRMKDYKCVSEHIEVNQASDVKDDHSEARLFESHSSDDHLCSKTKDCEASFTSDTFCSKYSREKSHCITAHQMEMELQDKKSSINCTESKMSLNPQYGHKIESCLPQPFASSLSPSNFKLNSQTLFTQDSQGNRVIAHKKIKASNEFINENERDVECLNKVPLGRRLTLNPLHMSELSDSPMPQHTHCLEGNESILSEKENFDFNSIPRFHSTQKQSNLRSEIFSIWNNISCFNQEDIMQDSGLQRPSKRAKLHETSSLTQQMLFTQDSEGNKVISHRCDRASPRKSPFKDWTNQSRSSQSCSSSKTSTCFHPCLEEGGPDRMLFTQDSEGNIVIKH